MATEPSEDKKITFVLAPDVAEMLKKVKEFGESRKGFIEAATRYLYALKFYAANEGELEQTLLMVTQLRSYEMGRDLAIQARAPANVLDSFDEIIASQKQKILALKEKGKVKL